MAETCSTCIMTSRFEEIERRLLDQDRRYIENQLDYVQRLTRVETNIETIKGSLEEVNKKLEELLEEKKSEEISKAKNQNKKDAQRWKIFSSNIGKIIFEVVKYVVIIFIGYLLAVEKII